MEIKNALLLAIAMIVCTSLIIFLIYKNKADLKTFNPDASDATEELRNDQERKRDEI
jgi:hypothetical protein